jgi:hypothetical protein
VGAGSGWKLSARWAEAAAFAGERDQEVVAARIAVHACKTVRENAAAQKCTELADDELGDERVLEVGLRDEGLEL